MPALHLHQVIWRDILDRLELTLHLYFKCEGAAAVTFANEERSATKIYSLGELDAMVASGRIVVAYRVNSSEHVNYMEGLENALLFMLCRGVCTT